MRRFMQLAFTPAVKAVQARMGSRRAYARVEDAAGAPEEPDVLGDAEVAFLGERDSFYMASLGSSGWPYIQHRGGPKGFLHVLDGRTLAFADLRGNRQYISVGNLIENDRVALICVDYPSRARLKLLARARLVTPADEPALFERVAGANGGAERLVVLHVEAFDWNCPRYITPRFTEEEVQRMARPLLDEVERLRRENADLRDRLLHDHR